MNRKGISPWKWLAPKGYRKTDKYPILNEDVNYMDDYKIKIKLQKEKKVRLYD